MIQTVKHNELARKEYHILPAVLMDAFDEGIEQGEARGSRQKALETAKNLLNFGLSRENIAKVTGLSQAEVEAIK